jgi:hypothetical protein
VVFKLRSAEPCRTAGDFTRIPQTFRFSHETSTDIKGLKTNAKPSAQAHAVLKIRYIFVFLTALFIP